MQTVGCDFGDEKQLFPINELENIMRIFYEILADARPSPSSSGGVASGCAVV